MTWAAQIMGLLQASGLTAEGIDNLVQASAVTAAARMGITVETLLTLPHAREVVTQARSVPIMLQNLVMTELFNPGGGWLAIGTAAMHGRVGHQFEAANRSGLVAGLVILYCATIRKHHPEMTASYNRAMHLVQTLHAKGKIKVGGDRERKTAWKESRGVGHVWAALWCGLIADEELQTSGRIFTQPAGIELIIGWAKWFHQFATTYRAVGATGPLVPPHEAVTIGNDIPAVEPPLTPLANELRYVAQHYRAPVPSQ